LFIGARPPFREFRSPCAMTMIVRRAMRRAKVTCPSRGAAHVLRHSAAASMLGSDPAPLWRHHSGWAGDSTFQVPQKPPHCLARNHTEGTGTLSSDQTSPCAI
jgi:hypothetical protein